jgi:integrase
MINSQLKASSVKTYLSNVLRAYRWSLPRQTYTRCKYALGKWEYQARHEETKRATFITLDEAKAIARKIPNPRARLAAEMLCYTPLRHADLCDVRWKQLESSEELLILLLVGGKTHRTTITQERYRMIKADLCPWLLRQLMTGLRKCSRDDHLVTIPTAEMNRILREVSGRPITTYSFRRAFHREVIRQCTRAGVVDWREVAERTLHRSEKTVKAHYDRYQ